MTPSLDRAYIDADEHVLLLLLLISLLGGLRLSCMHHASWTIMSHFVRLLAGRTRWTFTWCPRPIFDRLIAGSLVPPIRLQQRQPRPPRQSPPYLLSPPFPKHAPMYHLRFKRAGCEVDRDRVCDSGGEVSGAVSRFRGVSLEVRRAD